MRRFLVAAVLVMVGTARAEPAKEPKETAAEAAARVWLAALIAPRGVVAVPAKDAPLDYVFDSPAKSCRALAAGRAATAAELGRVKACMFDTWKDLDVAPTSARPPREWDPEPILEGFHKKYRKQMTAAAAGATVVLIQHIGAGRLMNSAIVVGKGGAIRAIWMIRTEFE
jgi:hypothetical protein